MCNIIRHTYCLILEGHIYSHTRTRLESCIKTHQEWVFPIYWLVLRVQLYHLDLTLCRGVSGYSYPSVRRLLWAIPYGVALAGQSRWLKWIQYNCMRMFSASPGRSVVLTPLRDLFKLGTTFSHSALRSIPSFLLPRMTFWNWSMLYWWVWVHSIGIFDFCERFDRSPSHTAIRLGTSKSQIQEQLHCV